MIELSGATELAQPTVVALARDGARLQGSQALPPFGELPRDSSVALSVSQPAELAMAYFALLEAGLVPLVLHPHLPTATARDLARSAGAAAFFHAPDGAPSSFELLSGSTRFAGLRGHVSCTSGTTGHGAVPSMYFFATRVCQGNARAHLASLGLGEAQRVQRMLLPMPLSHSFGLVAGLHAAAQLDATLFACTSTPDPSTLLTVLERERIELCYLTPPLLRMLLKRARGKSLGDLPDLKVVSVGSASVTRGELRGMLRCFPGARGYFTYGLTELGPRVSTFSAGTHSQPDPCLEHDSERQAPLGAPLSGVSTELCDVGADGVGQLFVTTPFASLGRLRDGVLEPLAMAEGFATCDAARTGLDGHVELLGRTDGTIVRGGTNVYPGNVESVADRVPFVRGSCLVARPSALYGQVPVLAIELEAGGDAETVKKELHSALAAALTPADLPVEIRVLASLPRSALGKVQRALVNTLMQEQEGAPA